MSGECDKCHEHTLECECLPNTKMEWITFIERFPKHNQMIKVKSENLWHGEGIFQDGKFVYSWVKGACFGNPTHWMPLPEPPKE